MDSRRSFLRSGLHSGLTALGGGDLLNVDPPAQAPRRATRADIDHLVLIVHQGRSFDQCFGTLHGVRGFDDAEATNATTAAAWLRGETYLTRQDLPFHYALADAFTVCDAYHCTAPVKLAGEVAYADAGALCQAIGTGALPAVATLRTGALSAVDEAGIQTSVLTALTADQALWAKTLILITYDGAGAGFDHVAPGTRVPMTAVSPFTRGGYVATEPLDPTSLEGDLTPILGFANPAKFSVKNLPNARLLALAATRVREQSTGLVDQALPAGRSFPLQESGTRATVASAQPPVLH